MVETIALPPLRQELCLFPAPPQRDGTPAWTIHDPPANRFYLLSWQAFEILSRWQLGSLESVIAAVSRETTLSPTTNDMLGMLQFLEQNFLLDLASPRATERLTAVRKVGRPGWATWLLHHYLFVRIPLIRPHRLLAWLTPKLTWLYSRTFAHLILLAMLGAMFLISRHWDIFRHSFKAYQSWEGLITVGFAIPIAKVAHEFGHAVTAYRYGCRVPTMGLAMVVLTPMLYTDTNEAWKLTSHRQRLAIGAAGIIAESVLALAAIWIWLLSPPGPVRSAAFIMATTTWLMTILLNVSPFMRFDGYFLLSDFLGFPNLHSRSFAFGRWFMRRLLFGLNDPPPEPVSPRSRRLLVAFSYIVWLYRFIIFLGIALLVYHFFFKALGILLFVVEIGWFILLPLYSEAAAWWQLRKRFRFNAATVTTLLILLTLITLLVIPWQGRVAAPAVLSAIREQQINVPFPAMVVNEPAALRQSVHAGDILLRLTSPDLEQRIRQARTSTSVADWQVAQQVFDDRFLVQGQVPQRRLDARTAELAGLLEEREQLTVSAPLDGDIVMRNDELKAGSWLARKEPLYVIVDKSSSRVDSYVGERDLSRIVVGAKARFIPEAPEFSTCTCRVADVDRIIQPALDEPSLASLYGGPIAARRDTQGTAILAENPVFRIRLDHCSPTEVPTLKLRGKVHIDAEKQSLLLNALRYAYAVMIRESGL